MGYQNYIDFSIFQSRYMVSYIYGQNVNVESPRVKKMRSFIRKDNALSDILSQLNRKSSLLEISKNIGHIRSYLKAEL